MLRQDSCCKIKFTFFTARRWIILYSSTGLQYKAKLFSAASCSSGDSWALKCWRHITNVPAHKRNVHQQTEPISTHFKNRNHRVMIAHLQSSWNVHKRTWLVSRINQVRYNINFQWAAILNSQSAIYLLPSNFPLPAQTKTHNNALSKSLSNACIIPCWSINHALHMHIWPQNLESPVHGWISLALWGFNYTVAYLGFEARVVHEPIFWYHKCKVQTYNKNQKL